MVLMWYLSIALLLLPAVQSSDKTKNDVTSNTEVDTKDLKSEATRQDLGASSQKNAERGYGGYAGYKDQKPWTEGRKWQDQQHLKSNSKYDYEQQNGKAGGRDSNYGKVNGEKGYSSGKNNYQAQNGGNYGDKDYGQVSQYNGYGKAWNYGNQPINSGQMSSDYNRGSSGGYANSDYGINGHVYNPYNYRYQQGSNGYDLEKGGGHRDYGQNYGNAGYVQSPDNSRYPNSAYGYEGYIRNRYGYPDFVYGHKYRHPDQKIWMGDSYRDTNLKPPGGDGNSYTSGYKDYGRYGEYGGYDSYGTHRSNYGQKNWSAYPGYRRVWYGPRAWSSKPWQNHYSAPSSYGSNAVWNRGEHKGAGWQNDKGKPRWH